MRWSLVVVAPTFRTAGPETTGHELGMGCHPAHQPFPQCCVGAPTPRGHLRKVTGLNGTLVRLQVSGAVC